MIYQRVKKLKVQFSKKRKTAYSFVNIRTVKIADMKLVFIGALLKVRHFFVEVLLCYRGR